MKNIVKEHFKGKSIQLIITLSFTLATIIAMIFIGFMFYNKYSVAAQQNVQMSTRQIIEQVSLNMDYYQNSIKSLSDLLYNSISTSQELPNARIEQQMDQILNTRDDVVAMAVFSDTGELVMGDPFSKLKSNINVKSQDWFKQAEASPQELLFSAPHVENLFEGRHNWVISHTRTITYNYKGAETQGVLLIDINFSSIDQLCRKASLGNRGYIYIINEKGELIYHPQQALIYAGLKGEDFNNIGSNSYNSISEVFQGEKRIVTIEPVSYMGWKVAGIFYMDDLIASRNELIRYAILIILFGTMFLIAIFVLISAKITKPIKELERSMKMVEEGQLDVSSNISGAEEIMHLSNAFNLMIARIKQLMDQIVLEQESKRKSELNALQAQINPHFLYNTLDSIVWMAENGKSQEVIGMVTALARLFRISISRGKNIITVEQELEHAKNYLIIQKIRYKNKFQYEIKAEEEVLKCHTVKLILQPIIENAIYHGIEYMVDEGFISISAGKFENKLLFEVTDNGLGMAPETIEKLLYSDQKDNKGTGVGVKNVHERIRLTYGEEYGINIESELEAGTKVKIWLPLIYEEE